MKTKKEIDKKISNSIKIEIEKLKNTNQEDGKFYNYLHKNFKKIFIKLAFPYFRFEILLQTINEIKKTSNYPLKTNKNILSHISKKLNCICIHLNIALDEYNKLIKYIGKKLNQF